MNKLAQFQSYDSSAPTFARPLEVVPTSVELPPKTDVYRSPHWRTVVWIGQPENLQYLELIRPALRVLVQRYPDLRLRVVCSEFPDWPEIPLERVPWSEEVEEWALRSAEIGIMPLTDDDGSRGECGFKLLQYMSHGLPCVASSIGANPEILLHGIHGFLVEDESSWVSALATLLENPAQAAIMGEQGQARSLSWSYQTYC